MKASLSLFVVAGMLGSFVPSLYAEVIKLQLQVCLKDENGQPIPLEKAKLQLNEAKSKEAKSKKTKPKFDYNKEAQCYGAAIEAFDTDKQYTLQIVSTDYSAKTIDLSEYKRKIQPPDPQSHTARLSVSLRLSKTPASSPIPSEKSDKDEPPPPDPTPPHVGQSPAPSAKPDPPELGDLRYLVYAVTISLCIITPVVLAMALVWIRKNTRAVDASMSGVGPCQVAESTPRDNQEAIDRHKERIRGIDLLVRQLGDIRVLLEEGNKQQERLLRALIQIQEHAGRSHPQNTRPEPPAWGLPAAGSSQESAQKCFLNLIHGIRTAHNPVYLNVDDRSSAQDALGLTNVHLLEVRHNQGSFVLFTSTEDAGWIYPNPALRFRPEALQRVFPTLTQSAFDYQKEQIQPVAATRLPDGRWKVQPTGIDTPSRVSVLH